MGEQARGRLGRALAVVGVFVALVIGGLSAGTADAPRAGARASHARSRVGPPSAPPGTCTNARVVDDWPLARQAAQVLMVSVDAGAATTVSDLVSAGVGGVLISGGSAPNGLASALAALHRAGGAVPPLLAVDEEGGRVQRLGGALPALASAREQAATWAADQVERGAARVGSALRTLGVDMDFAPDADVDGGPSGGPIGDRSFSPDPARAAVYAAAFARGLERAGVIPVIKHFPGHGHADGDTDYRVAATPSIDRLRAADLVPFEALVATGIPAVMVGHLQVPGLTEPGRPASLSPAAIGLLRNGLGFGGLIVTDSLSMGAVSTSGRSVPGAAVEAIEAGADLALFSSIADAPATVGAIGAAVGAGALPRARLRTAIDHVLTVKHVDLCSSRS